MKSYNKLPLEPSVPLWVTAVVKIWVLPMPAPVTVTDEPVQNVPVVPAVQVASESAGIRVIRVVVERGARCDRAVRVD